MDTCAGAFFLYKDSAEVMDCLTQYDMIAVDEVSQLSQKDFERIIQMWEDADRVPCLVFAGDFWQLPGVQPTRATDSPKWRMVHQIELHEMWRCKDETLREKLVALRTSMPTKKLLKRIALRHKAWSGHHQPTAWDLQQLYRSAPHHDRNMHPESGRPCERPLHMGALHHQAQAAAGRAEGGLGVERRQLRP